jgi:hypothetical protein
MWESISDGNVAPTGAGLAPLKAGSAYSVVREERILTLRPDRDELFGELQVISLALPEHLERLRAAKKKEVIVNMLQLCDEPVIGTNSLEVCCHSLAHNSVMPLALGEAYFLFRFHTFNNRGT